MGGGWVECLVLDFPINLVSFPYSSFCCLLVSFSLLFLFSVPSSSQSSFLSFVTSVNVRYMDGSLSVLWKVRLNGLSCCICCKLA